MTQPRYVRACERGEWSIHTWDKSDAGKPRLSPFRCRSWRHPGECRDWCFACDYARTLTAIEKHEYWTFAVLTYSHREYDSPDHIFKDGVIHWSRFRKRLVERYGKIGYIQTWEVHKSSYPHVNVLITSQRLFSALRPDFRLERDAFWIPAATEVGYGPVMYIAPMRSKSLSAWYISKNANELCNARVKDQYPMNAPPHFRRIRASRGMLPKRAHDPSRTGMLFFSEFDRLKRAMESDVRFTIPIDGNSWKEVDDGPKQPNPAIEPPSPGPATKQPQDERSEAHPVA